MQWVPLCIWLTEIWVLLFNLIKKIQNTSQGLSLRVKHGQYHSVGIHLENRVFLKMKHLGSLGYQQSK